MSVIARVNSANQWYDRLSQRDGALIVIWAGLGLLFGALLLNFYLGLTFWALLLVGLAVLVGCRLMYRLGRLPPVAPAVTGPAEVRLPYAPSLLALNQWFDEQPPLTRMCQTMGWLYGSFAVNLMLTHRIGFPFGLLFIAVAVTMLVARVGHGHGWLGSLQAARPAAPKAPPRPAIAAPPPIDVTPDVVAPTMVAADTVTAETRA